ncbi:MAG: putative zinc protease [Myxococcaceae bacterium]|nr:putative zinc protease [Myxococcaceae bacterium]
MNRSARRVGAVLFAVWSTLAGRVASQPAPRAPAAAPASLQIPVQRERLDNGLRVVLSPDHSVPTVAIALYYDVGARVEPQGQTGFAHLFEHLMFEGTDGLPKGEFDRLLSRVGADSNATTSEDRTNYFEQLPAHALELGVWLEADRMRALAITGEAFENQRLTVMEERRQSYENRPYMRSFLRRDEILYDGYFPYSHSTIGDVRDLEMPGVSPADQIARVRAFHTRFYAPDNAVLAIAGDFDPAEALAMVRRHFGDIQARRGDVWQDPGYTPPVGERVESMVDPHAEVPGFHVAWHVPPRRTPDHYPLEVLATVLGGGQSSRFYRTLVHDRELLSEISVDTEDRRGPDLFGVWAICSQGHAPAEVRRALDAIVAAVNARGITARELEKAKNNIRAAFVFGLQRPLERAEFLGMSELYDGDAGVVNGELARYQAVTLADVRRVAAQYLVPTNRIVLDVMPPTATRTAAPSE